MKKQETVHSNVSCGTVSARRSLASCLVFAAASVAASGALAQAKVSNVSVNPYGQLNYGLLFGDTGDGSEHFIVDNDNSASRVGARLSGDLNDTGLTIGAHLELEYQQNPSNAVSLNERSISGEFNERHLNVFVSGGFGKLSLGQGDGAANGNIERDLSGTLLVSWTNPALVGGGLEFLEESSATRVRLISAMSDQDFESRYSRLRYDLPSIGGIQPAVSQGIKGEDDVTEVGARFSGELGGKIIGAVGFSTRDVGGQADRFQTLGGSVSWLHDSGINLTGAYSTTSDDNPANPDADFYLGKLGYKSGQHAFDVHYAVTEDRLQQGDSAETIGVGYVFQPIKWFDTYAGVNRHSLDRPGADFEDITTVLVGGRLKF
ncbi:Outer membrane protein (porin) [Marinobacter gudaonensis]|uniref:Outer membrane protein (Porin) n=2 Tax=Marinobacter gudaonensis TaxID=375760 RepID=A0A1I6HPG2_9GAMM|nr:Outer membrane protein (porin) [Marinobacter gudaonensis]